MRVLGDRQFNRGSCCLIMYENWRELMRRHSVTHRNTPDIKVNEAQHRVDTAKKTRALSIDLSGLGLSAFPSTIWELHHLEELYAGGNRLRVLPHQIGRLTRLTLLDLKDNSLDGIADSLSRLTELRTLVLSGNRLASLPKSLASLGRLQTLRVDENRLTSLSTVLCELKQLLELDVSHNQLECLPSLARCTRLTALYISGNRLKTLQDWIGALTSLTSLCACSNQLLTLPEAIYKLHNLQFLALCDNPLQALPKGIEKLKSLRGLAISTSPCITAWSSQSHSWTQSLGKASELLSLPRGLQSLAGLRELYLHGQAKLSLPPEVLGPTWLDVHTPNDSTAPGNPNLLLAYYYRTHGEGATNRPLNEAKMILVGRGGVGKTSLVKRLTSDIFEANEVKTDGISIQPWSFRLRNEDIHLNVWDFGGQEIMHSTHQFFLTKRSLYLLVLNAREGEQDANVDYWLRLIESFGGESPVIVVINKAMEHSLDLNRRGLAEKFPTIKGFVHTDCAGNTGISELRNLIIRETDRLEHLRDPFPAPWFAVKERLANLQFHEKKDYISFTRYQQLCLDHGIDDAIGQETLVGFLHDLGVVVNFRDDPRLSELHILNPEWVTTGIYKILNADRLAQNRGELKSSDLNTVLPKNSYPASMHLFLLDLMRKFELCYEFYDSPGNYLVPELLGKEEADLSGLDLKGALRFDYRYSVLPEGLLPRFIVRCKVLNRSQARWRTGVVLEWEGNTAIVKADAQDKHVSIAVLGPIEGRRRILAVIRADLERIHHSIPRLQARAEVPVPDNPGVAIDHETLLVLESAGELEHKIVHSGRLLTVRVRELLRGVDETKRGREGFRGDTPQPVRVAFSYSHKDEELRDQFETHLKLLQNQGIVASWSDRKITPGDTWREAIDEQFIQADIILLLISADFLASSYCYEIEMKSALERHRKKETRVVPVILRACDFRNAPFSDLQAIPKDARPVTSWNNRDEAWNDVVRGLRSLVDEIRELKSDDRSDDNRSPAKLFIAASEG